jgi:hypothetical protein
VLKWLIITIIVLIGFFVILLSLGYLLKENEEKTTELIAQLEQAAYQQQQEREKGTKSYLSQTTLNALEQSQKKIIENNLNCQSSKQCFLVQTNSENIGCIVAVNTTGAAILLKVSSQKGNESSASKKCRTVYQNINERLAQCKNNICTL